MHKAAGLGLLAIFLGLSFFTLLLLPVPAWAAQEPPESAEDYVGAETCGFCHAEQLAQFQKTYMAAVLAEKYPVEQQGCEACHGPGSAHVEAAAEAFDEAAIERAVSLIYSFARHSPAENAARCLTCHRKNENERLFGRSRHLGVGVFCGDCHSAHLPNTRENLGRPSATLNTFFSTPDRPSEQEWLNNRLLRINQPKLCYGCHQDIEAQFQLPVRHRVNEGLIQCTDCHNPHGSLTAKSLRAAGTEACYTCHVEKRGPFVFEHAPVRVEGCTACHTPHGSINAHLMKRRQERQLCLECHVPPEAAGVPHPRLGFQTSGECSRCHVGIHGSNFQRQFLR